MILLILYALRAIINYIIFIGLHYDTVNSPLQGEGAKSGGQKKGEVKRIDYLLQINFLPNPNLLSVILI